LGQEFLTQTRHLAALGLSQETDAVVVVVSEQTGNISLAYKGRLEKTVDWESLKEKIAHYMKK
jgi:diadenylate cyclase